MRASEIGKWPAALCDTTKDPADHEASEEEAARHRALTLPAEWSGTRPLLWTVSLVTAALMITLRLVALDSDAYARLSWSAALLTDEGFYIHNARNVVLIGHAHTDGFNNDLIMPALHYVQVAVFSMFGVGAVQARLISVTLSLIMLLIFFAALRRVFGLPVAAAGTLFLGLDHVNLLYNRMALMDTPAAFLMVCAFYAFVRGLQSPSGASRIWLVVCGLLLGLTFATRGLAAFLIPVPFLLLSQHRERLHSVGVGLAVALMAYGLLWYLPHRAEMAPASRYYLEHQLNPHSFLQAGRNLMHALFGDARGMSPYLFRHTPIQFLLALAALLAWGLEFRKRQFTPDRRTAMLFLGLWLLAAWMVLSIVSYAPSRYYVLFYPALAGVAALTLISLPEVIERIAVSRGARTLLGGFTVFHLAEAFLHRQSAANEIAVYVITAVTVVGIWIGAQRRQTEFWKQSHARWDVALALLLWAAVNLYWTGDWLANLSYTQRDADRWLAENLPANSVLIGDVAPGLCLDNHFVAVNVIPGLCNDRAPVEQFAPAPRYIVILDGKWKETWWLQRYPQYLGQAHRSHLFPRLLHWPVGVYTLESPNIARIAIKSKGGV